MPTPTDELNKALAKLSNSLSRKDYCIVRTAMLTLFSPNGDMSTAGGSNPEPRSFAGRGEGPPAPPPIRDRGMSAPTKLDDAIEDIEAYLEEMPAKTDDWTIGDTSTPFIGSLRILYKELKSLQSRTLTPEERECRECAHRNCNRCVKIVGTGRLQ